MDRAPIDLSRPPLPFVPTASPRDAARQVVAAFHAVATLADRVGWVHRAVSAEIGPAADATAQALLAAGTAIAADIDRGALFHDRHPYHNRQHFCEVMLTAHFLCRWHDLPARDARLVLLAALVHDIDHDGVPGGLFEFERRSMARAAPFLVAAGVDIETREALEALVLATEPRRGVLVAVDAHRWHLRAGMPPQVDAVLPELERLAADAGLARAAVLLCEADVLPSVGLTFDHAMRLQARLSREWGCPLDDGDKARFIDDVLQAGVIGAFFLPNVLALRQALARPTR